MGLSQISGIFYAQIVGATGAFAAPAAAPAPGQNPINNDGSTCTPARSGAGVYTLTFNNAKPQSEYDTRVDLNPPVGAPPAALGNVQWGWDAASKVLTVNTFAGAGGVTATDVNFDVTLTPLAS